MHRDKVWVNSFVSLGVCGLFLLLGALWHSAFFIVAAFSASIAAISAIFAFTKPGKIELDHRVKHGGLGFMSDERSESTSATEMRMSK